MVAKINRGASLYGAITYNQHKVDEKTARIISSNRIISDLSGNPDRIMPQILLSFENYLQLNKRTEKPILHISLNPALEDNLSDSKFSSLAKDYMEKMGYADQPYLVYLHEDTGRRHIHIVSTCVDETGKKISDKFEWERSMKACRELEEKYSLRKVSDKRKEALEPYLKKVDYKAGNIKGQISNILKSVSDYRFQSFGEYTALLSCYNIETKLVKGDYEGTAYRGIIYSVTDEKGKAVGIPIKSSMIGKKYGYEGLEQRMKRHSQDYKDKKWGPKISNEVALAMHGCNGNKKRFCDLLSKRGIDVVFRQNDQGRIYGVTFIDHNQREVYNGSRLGKQFSANTFQELFTRQIQPLSNNTPKGAKKNVQDMLGKSFNIEQAFGILDFQQHNSDYQEEQFARRLRKKKKKHSIKQF